MFYLTHKFMKKCTIKLFKRSKKLLLVMKLTFFLMFLAVINVTASVYSQGNKLQLQLKNVELVDVFNEIKAQTDFDFLYKSELLKDQPKVNLTIKNGNVNDVLNDVLPANLEYEIYDKTIIIKKNNTLKAKTKVTPEEAKVEGTITDENGSGLPGASVVVKGTTKGTVTDINGNYSLTIADDAVLQFSYIGYLTQEIRVGVQSTINISLLPDIKQLDDIVVVGYGTQRKSNISGAVTTVANIKGRSVTNTEEALQGNVAGVTVVNQGGDPTNRPSIRIRGLGTTADESPLWVVDGVPYYGGPLNPFDIESMTVLKDAASTAIYGVRAAGGVILVTTKKGRIGELQVDFNSYIGMQKVWNKPKALDAAGQSKAYKTAANNDGVAVPSAHADTNTDGKITRTDWVDEIFRPGYIQNYDVAIRGGNEKMIYSTSFGYNKREGTLLNTQADRFTFRVNSELKLSDKLKVGENISYTRTNGNTVFTGTQTSTGGSNYNGIIVQAMAAPPTVPVYDQNGNYSGISTSDYGDTFNVVAALNRVDVDNPVTDLFGNLYLDYDIIEGLKFRSSYGINLKERRFTEFKPSVPEPSKIQSDQNSIQKIMSSQKDWSFENTFTYDKQIAKHSVTLLGGYTLQSFSYEEYGITGINLPNEDRDLLYLNNATEFFQPTVNVQENSLASFLGRVNYSYNGKYSLSASVRRDGSSKLKKNKWGVFPAVSFAWTISKESFMASQSWLNSLKLRTSWGKIGNISSLSNYPTSVSLSPTSVILGSAGYVNGFALDGISNPDITWETTNQTNIGLDLLVFEGRISMTSDFFIKRTKDLILPLPLTALAGVNNAPFKNAGEVENKGLELALSYIKDEGDFTYTVSANVSKINNKLVSLSEGIVELPDATEVRTHAPIQSIVGQPLFSFYLVETDGIFQSDSDAEAYVGVNGRIQPVAKAGDLKFKDANGDGEINEKDRVYKGNAFPEFTYGLNANLGFKNFDLAVFFQGVKGSQAYNGFKFTTLSTAGAGFNLSADVNDAWSETNKGGAIPVLSLSDPNNNLRKSDYFLEDSDYVRLKNITLGYTFPDFGKVRRLRAYVTAQNLLTITNYSGLDPEVSRKGVDGGQYPISKAFIFGINLGL